MDRLTVLENDPDWILHGKLGACLAASRYNSGGVAMAAMSMFYPLSQMGFVMPPWGVLWHPGDHHMAGETMEDFGMNSAEELGEDMVRLSTVLQMNFPEWWGTQTPKGEKPSKEIDETGRLAFMTRRGRLPGPERAV